MTPKYPVVLASASPRRLELLGRVFSLIEVVPSEFDESSVEPIPGDPANFVLVQSVNKATSVAISRPDCIVIGADTIVVLKNKILGKPVNAADATRMLTELSGNRHFVFTGVTILFPTDQRLMLREETEVRFRQLSSIEIDEYVATSEPMDKAGAYAIQGGAAGFVEDIFGDYDNVVGLPLKSLTEMLLSHKLIKKEV